jgi:exopolyphosphatase / guanosine-5'-triphosphate,3'-diphosphate pyrophosphatase
MRVGVLDIGSNTGHLLVVDARGGAPPMPAWSPRLTFLAVRRWFGWSSGRLAVFDIGGGSLELAVGSDEAPDLRRTVRQRIARDAGTLARVLPDHSVATSKTFRSLARVCGAAPSAEGPLVRRVLDAATLRDRLPGLVAMPTREIAELPGVSPDRAHQILAGALVADAVMDLFGLSELEICPWALREGIILERLDRISVRA